MFHIYTGDGKGKTTAAVGLAIRAASAGKKVLFFQFLKSDSSNERRFLQNAENITTMDICEKIPFLCNADAEKRAQMKNLYHTCLENIYNESKNFDVIILDEAVSAIDEGLICADQLFKLIPEAELIITGRGDISSYSHMADYITEMKKIKHPYDKGIFAREGIEY